MNDEEEWAMKEKEQGREDWIYEIFSSIIVFMMTYMIITFYREHPGTDFWYHTALAENFHMSQLGEQIKNGNTYFMWSALTGLLHRRGKVDLYSASAVITALANVAALHFVLDYIKRKVPQIDNASWLYFGVGVMFVGPLYFPWINSFYYLGTWSPNQWHNPTNNMVRPFAILSIILILDILESGDKPDWKKHVALSIMLFLSVLAKPSFIQGIAPALALYVIVETISMRRLALQKYLLLAATFLPAVCYMFVQIRVNLYEDQTREGIGVEFLRVQHRYVDNAGAALLAGIAFPLFVTVMAIAVKKGLAKNARVLLMVCYLVSTWCEMSFLYEKGGHEGDANFAWGYMLGLFVAFVLASIEFLEMQYLDFKYENAVKKTGLILFSVHLLFGIWVVYVVLSSGEYLI